MILLLDFHIPHDNDTNDLPAIWSPNFRIPYTTQDYKYSCCASGCEEQDGFGVLALGEERGKSAAHIGGSGVGVCVMLGA